MTTAWFHCSKCEIDFTDPHAPEHDGLLHGKCPKCELIWKREPPEDVSVNDSLKPCIECGDDTALWRPEVDPPRCPKCRFSQSETAETGGDGS